MKFHHAGVACRNIEEGIASISKIHQIIKKSPVVFDKEQNAELVLLTLSDGTNKELISGKPVETLLKKNITYYHLRYEVDNIDLEIERLVNERAFLISQPKPVILFDNRNVAFLNASMAWLNCSTQNKDSMLFNSYTFYYYNYIEEINNAREFIIVQ